MKPTGNPSMLFMVVAEIIAIALSVGFAVLVQLALGNRFRKSTPPERRYASAFIAYMPIWGALFVYFGRSYLQRASTVGLCFYMAGWMVVFGAWLFLCVRFVPAKVSWWIGGFVWAVTLWGCLSPTGW